MPHWLIAVALAAGVLSICALRVLARDCWTAYQAGLAQERQLARLREREAERRRQHRVDGRIDRREP